MADQMEAFLGLMNGWIAIIWWALQKRESQGARRDADLDKKKRLSFVSIWANSHETQATYEGQSLL